MATTYDRLTLKDGTRVILRNLTERPLASEPGEALVSGVEVNVEGDEVRRRTPDGRVADETTHVIQKSLISSREPLRLNLHYGQLERTTNDNRAPYYPGK